MATIFLTNVLMHSTLFNDRTMKARILNALKTKYSHLGFSAKALDGVASVIEKTITEDSQIDDAVAGVEGLLRVFQADSDRSRTEYNTLKGQYEDLLKKQSNGNGGGQNEPTEEEPAWFKAYKAEQEQRYNTMKNESDAMKAEKAKNDRLALIANKAKELGIPEWRVKEGFVIDDSADETAIVSYLSGIQTNLVTAGLGGKGLYPLAGDQKATKEDADKIVSGMKF